MERKFRAFSKSENKMFYDVLVDSSGWKTKDGLFSGENHIMQCLNIEDDPINHIYERDIFNYSEKTNTGDVDINLFFAVGIGFHVISVIVSAKCIFNDMKPMASFIIRNTTIKKDYFSIFYDEKNRWRFKKIGNCYENSDLVSEIKKVPKGAMKDFYYNMFGVTEEMIKANENFGRC